MDLINRTQECTAEHYPGNAAAGADCTAKLYPGSMPAGVTGHAAEAGGVKEHYLDNAATTQVCREAADMCLKLMLEDYGNPSSTHRKGREAAAVLAESRKTLAAALGADPSEIYFTSCGSESDNWAIIRGAEYMSRKGRHIISSTVEHSAVKKSLELLEKQGFEVTLLNPDSTGKITAQAVKAALRPDTVLVTLMMVNNETGAVNDIAGIAKMLAREAPAALLHTDAVQAFMKVPFKAKTLGAHMISISGHKIHAPKGIGALYIKKGINLKPLFVGGGQEGGLRAGTESLPLIGAFAVAADIARKGMTKNIELMRAFKTDIATRLKEFIPELVVLDTEAPHILLVALPGFRSEVLMNFLEERGVYVSKSSACKRGARSYVLEAAGMDSRAIDGAVRIGLSRMTTAEDVDALVEGLKEAHEKLAHR